MVLKRSVLAGALLMACAGAPSGPTNDSEAGQWVQRVSAAFAESVEREKLAVLATTDAESVRFANESRAAAAQVDQGLAALQVEFEKRGANASLTVLREVETAWAEVRRIDADLLPLAEENSNLKAQALMNGAGLETLNQLVQRAQGVPGGAAVAIDALQVQVLLPAHIASADDAFMTQQEQAMAVLRQRVTAALEKAGRGHREFDALKELWRRYETTVDDVVRLSRRNTNVRSFDLSVHQKAEATRQFSQALEVLKQQVTQRPRPTR